MCQGRKCPFEYDRRGHTDWPHEAEGVRRAKKIPGKFKIQVRQRVRNVYQEYDWFGRQQASGKLFAE